MASVDPNLPIISIRTLREQVASQFTQQRLIARLTSFFGILSLVLASIGLYGVTAYNAGRRVNEIGVRMALGADRGDVVALVLRGAFGLIRLWTVDRVAVDVCRGAIPGQSALRHESIQSRSDAGSRRGAGIFGAGRIADSSAPSKLDFAARSVARRVTRRYRCLSASNSSGVRGQSSRNNRERARSASSRPPVWQVGQ